MARPDNLSDGELVVLVASGGTEAFGVLWNRYYRQLRSIILRFVREDEADDFVQETAVRALVALQSGKYVHEDHFFAWVCSVARNAIVDARRRSKHVCPLEEAVATASESASPERQAIVRSLLAFLDTQLDECLNPSKDAARSTVETQIKKLAFVWYYADEYSLPEVTKLVSAEFLRHDLQPPTSTAVNNWLGGGRLLHKLVTHLVKEHADMLDRLNEQAIADARLTEDEAKSWNQMSAFRGSPQGRKMEKTGIPHRTQVAEKKIAQTLTASIASSLHESRFRV